MAFCQLFQRKAYPSWVVRITGQSYCVDSFPVTATPELVGRSQLGCVERSSLLSVGIAGEPAEASRAVKEAHCRQPASGLTQYERGNERPAGFGVLLHQTLQGQRDLMDGIGWRQLKQSGESAIGDRSEEHT